METVLDKVVAFIKELMYLPPFLILIDTGLFTSNISITVASSGCKINQPLRNSTSKNDLFNKLKIKNLTLRTDADPKFSIPWKTSHIPG